MDLDYFQKRSLNMLPPEQQQTELNLERDNFFLELYKEDLDFCKENKINVGRIIRLEFHKWLKKEREQ